MLNRRGLFGFFAGAAAVAPAALTAIAKGYGSGYAAPAPEPFASVLSEQILVGQEIAKGYVAINSDGIVTGFHIAGDGGEPKPLVAFTSDNVYVNGHMIADGAAVGADDYSQGCA